MTTEPTAAPVLPAIDPDQPAFIRVPVKCIPTVIESLARAVFTQESRSVADFSRDYTDPVLNAERLRWLDLADEQVARDGHIEIDSDATISRSDDNGGYVLAWVWVDGDDEPEEDEIHDDVS